MTHPQPTLTLAELALLPSGRAKAMGIALEAHEQGWRICLRCGGWFRDEGFRLLDDPPVVCGELHCWGSTAS